MFSAIAGKIFFVLIWEYCRIFKFLLRDCSFYSKIDTMFIVYSMEKTNQSFLLGEKNGLSKFESKGKN